MSATKTLPRWAGWVGSAAFIGLLAGVLVWWMHLRTSAPAAVTVAAPVSAASVPEAAAASDADAQARRVDLAVGAAAARVADASGSRPPAPHNAARAASAAAGWEQATLEVCGLGQVTLMVPPPGGVPDEQQVPPALGAPARAAVWPELLVAMAAAPDPVVQGAGWMLRAAGVHLEDTPGIAPSLRQQERERATHALARLATTSSDWTLWAWALSTCHRARGEAPTACSGINPEAAVRRVPDDANAWLTLAAAQPGGSPEQASSMARAAASTRVSSNGFALAAAVDRVWPAGQPAYLHESFMVIAIGVQAATVDFSGFGALRWCVPESSQPVPAERRGTCDALAQLMHEQGQDLYAAGVARSLARRLDWPAAQQQAMEEDSRRVTEAIVASSTAHMPFSCESAAVTRRWVQDAHRRGERAAARAMAADRAATQPPASPLPQPPTPSPAAGGQPR